MGIDIGVDTLALGPMRYARLHRSRANPGTAIADKQGAFFGTCHCRSRVLPLRERFERIPAHGNDAVFVALARDAHGFVVHVDIAAVEVGQFGQAQSRGIKQLQHCPVTVDKGPVAGNIEQSRHAIDIEVSGKALLALWGRYRRNRVLGHEFFAHQVAKERARRRQLTLNASGTKALSKTCGGKRPDVSIIQGAPLVEAGRPAKRTQCLEIATIVFAGQR